MGSIDENISSPAAIGDVNEASKELDWPEAAARWSLEPGRAHLNHGSFGAVPDPVLAEQDRWRQMMESNPVRFMRSTLPEAHTRARMAAASLLGADPEGTVLVPNATTAVATALNAVGLKPGDEVLLTDHAYAGVIRVADHVARRAGASTVLAAVDLPADSEADLVSPIIKRVTSATRVAVIDHVASATGICMPVAGLIAALREQAVTTIVDGAHAPGMVEVDLGGPAPDFWCGNFHKWVCAPRGCAALWVAPPWRDRCTPLVPTYGIELGFPQSFEWQGTSDYTPYLALPSAIELMELLGWERLRENNRALARAGREIVAAAGLRAPVHDSFARAMTLLALPEAVASTEGEALAAAKAFGDAGFEIAITLFRGRPYLRLSAHAYNRMEEYERLARALPELAGLTA